MTEVNQSITVIGVSITTKLISRSDWINTPNHFVWSKESRYESRIKKAKGAHLRGVMTPTMSVVHIAEYSCGYIELLDSNSRQQAAIEEKLKNIPDNLISIVYKIPNTFQSVEGKQKSKDLFMSFDNKNAVDSASDYLNYALKEQNIVASSSLMSSSIATAIKYASKKITPEGQTPPSTLSNQISTIKEGFIKVDRLGLDTFDMGQNGMICPTKIFSTGTRAALLVIAQKDGNQSLSFIEDLADPSTTNNTILTLRNTISVDSYQVTGAQGLERTYDHVLSAYRAYRNSMVTTSLI